MAITQYVIRRAQEQIHASVISSLSGTIYYHWYVDGVWQGMTQEPEFYTSIRIGEQADLVCQDTNDAAYDYTANAPAFYPATRTLWFNESADDDVAYYLLQQATGSSTPGSNDWTTIDGGKVWHRDRWAYKIETRRLTDLTWYWFRVVPYDRAGNAGTALVLSKEFIVRKPDAPDYVSSFVGTDITVS